MTYRVTYTDSTVTDAALPGNGYYTVPLADGSISVRYGTPDNPSAGDAPPGQPPNLTAHTIKIYDASNALVETYNRPAAQWRTHFRYPPMGSVVKRSVAWLIDNNFVPAYGYSDLQCFPLETLTYDGPNCFAGLQRGMGTTGERRDIGVFTEDTAHAIMGEDPTAMFIQAECASVAPTFFIDKATNKPIDRRVYPTANDYSIGSSYHGSPWMSAAKVSEDPYNGVDIGLSSNHEPCLSFVPAMLTDDGWHLRNLQYWANEIILTNGATTSTGSAVVLEEQRDLAWSLRTQIAAYLATKHFEDNNILPADCLDSAYFLTIVNNTLTYTINPIMAAADYQVVRAIWDIGQIAIAPWQQCYILEVLGWAVLNGLTQFKVAYLWLLGLPVAMNSGKSGWPAAMSSVYYLGFGTLNADGKTVTPFASWAAIWQNYTQPIPTGQLGDQLTQQQFDQVNADPLNGGNFPTGLNQEYCMSMHGILAFALYLKQKGIVDTVAAYPDLPTAYANVHRMFVNSQTTGIANNAPSGDYLFDARVAFSFDSSKLPADVIIQPTPTNPQPQPTIGVTLMPTTFALTGSETTIPFVLAGVDSNGNAAPIAGLPAYTVSPPNAGTFAPSSGGGVFTRAAGFSGNVTISETGATDANGGALPATESDGTVAAPLAVAAVLTPGSPS